MIHYNGNVFGMTVKKETVLKRILMKNHESIDSYRVEMLVQSINLMAY